MTNAASVTALHEQYDEIAQKKNSVFNKRHSMEVVRDSYQEQLDELISMSPLDDTLLDFKLSLEFSIEWMNEEIARLDSLKWRYIDEMFSICNLLRATSRIGGESAEEEEEEEEI